MTWATTKEACRLAIAAALSLTDYTGADGVVGGVHKVEWANKMKAVNFTNDSAWVRLQLNAPVAHGRDETRYTLTVGATAALTKNIPVYSGQRHFSVSVQIGVESQEDGEEAVGQLGGKLRTRLRRAVVLAILQDAEVALRRIGPTIPTDYRDSTGRWVSSSVTELELTCVETDTDATETGDYISSTTDAVGTFAGGFGDVSADANVVVEPAYEVII